MGEVDRSWMALRASVPPVAEITEIRWKSGAQASARIYLDGEFRLTVKAAQVKRFGLVAGLAVDDPDALARELLLERAKSFLLGSLGARAQSERELERKLAERG